LFEEIHAKNSFLYQEKLIYLAFAAHLSFRSLMSPISNRDQAKDSKRKVEVTLKAALCPRFKI
jgi:hypothetical protein